MNPPQFFTYPFFVLLSVTLLAACVGPQGKSHDGGTTFVLRSTLPQQPGHAKSASTLMVAPMRAHPGFDTPRMAYRRDPNQIAYYASNRWVDAPARMLTPLVTQALEASSAFGAVVQAPGPVHATLRLDTELIDLSQDFGVQPSMMHLVLRAQLVDTHTQSVLASKLFAGRAKASTEDARGGVDAANQLLPDVMNQLARWAVQKSQNLERR